MGEIITVVTAVRTVRSEMNVPPSAKLRVDAVSPSRMLRDMLAAHQTLIGTLAGLSAFRVHENFTRPATAAVAVVEGCEIFVDLEGIIKVADEKRRLQKEIDKINGDIQFLSAKLGNDDFLSRAPAAVVEKEKKRLASLTEKKAKLSDTLERIAGLCG